MSVIKQHPFKEGVLALIGKHVDVPVAQRFELIFETELFDKNADKFVWAQAKSDRLVMEVRYRNPGDDTATYITDVYSWESKGQTEARLLRGITDKLVTGQIGGDWTTDGDKIQISKDIKSKRYETPDEQVNPNTA